MADLKCDPQTRTAIVDELNRKIDKLTGILASGKDPAQEDLGFPTGAVRADSDGPKFASTAKRHSEWGGPAWGGGVPAR